MSEIVIFCSKYTTLNPEGRKKFQALFNYTEGALIPNRNTEHIGVANVLKFGFPMVQKQDRGHFVQFFNGSTKQLGKITFGQPILFYLKHNFFFIFKKDQVCQKIGFPGALTLTIGKLLNTIEKQNSGITIVFSIPAPTVFTSGKSWMKRKKNFSIIFLT